MPCLRFKAGFPAACGHAPVMAGPCEVPLSALTRLAGSSIGCAAPRAKLQASGCAQGMASSACPCIAVWRCCVTITCYNDAHANVILSVCR